MSKSTIVQACPYKTRIFFINKTHTRLEKHTEEAKRHTAIDIYSSLLRRKALDKV